MYRAIQSGWDGYVEGVVVVSRDHAHYASILKTGKYKFGE